MDGLEWTREKYAATGARQAGKSAEEQKAAQEQARQQDEAINGFLSQCMDQNARARLNTLKISRPDKAKMVEQIIVRSVRSGQVQGRIDEPTLIGMLEQVNSQMPKTTSSVKFDRRRAAIDSDDEDDYGC
ncbi:uncharacterized protein D2005.3 isoform X1 [Contarinia nasturtii]|uniref:uncharacterized protein D2005.3 isoform X1 n=1 Tax=Contarinia nasturtii TaxID=265458 RepID=UPI0012D421AD|nr:uncharacterized protein D2005.3 isoform X1 [Contarinia nasturtii]XP_031629300.1 uncharacterized protein D2005.3 isoform X1 [Contarinia nasturtii]